MLHEDVSWSSATRVIASDDFKQRLCAVTPDGAPMAAVELADKLMEDAVAIAFLQRAGDQGACAGALAAWILAIARCISAAMWK